MDAAVATRPAGRGWGLGCPVDAVTLDQALNRVDEAVTPRPGLQPVAVNAAKVVRLQPDDDLRKAIEGCELITADGQAVVWAAGILGQNLPERVAGIDLMTALLERAPALGYRVYLLGATEEVVSTVAARILE